MVPFFLFGSIQFNSSVQFFGFFSSLVSNNQFLFFFQFVAFLSPKTTCFILSMDKESNLNLQRLFASFNFLARLHFYTLNFLPCLLSSLLLFMHFTFNILRVFA